MFSKGIQKQKHKIIIPQIKNRQNSRSKPSKQQLLADFNQYQTDQKKNINQNQQSIQEIKEIMLNCNHCRTKISQFVTKKPIHSQDKAIQTTHKPFLIDLIQEKVDKLCMEKTKVERLLEQRQQELADRQNQMNQIEDKFTSILLSLSQQIAFRRKKGIQWFELERVMHCDSQTPAYLKALSFDL